MTRPSSAPDSKVVWWHPTKAETPRDYLQRLSVEIHLSLSLETRFIEFGRRLESEDARRRGVRAQWIQDTMVAVETTRGAREALSKPILGPFLPVEEVPDIDMPVLTSMKALEKKSSSMSLRKALPWVLVVLYGLVYWYTSNRR